MKEKTLIWIQIWELLMIMIALCFIFNALGRIQALLYF